LRDGGGMNVHAFQRSSHRSLGPEWIVELEKKSAGCERECEGLMTLISVFSSTYNFLRIPPRN
jgi:hypothetical protein